MIRVLQLCSTSDLGGAERMVLNLASAMNGNEIEVHIGSLIGSGSLNREAERLGIPQVRFNFAFPADPRGIWALIKYCRQHKIQVIQTHGLRADGIARWAGRLGGVCVIISTLHSIDPWRRKPHVMLDRLTAPFVTRYVAVCEAARRAAIKRGEIREGDCDVIHIGVPPREIPRHDRDAIRESLNVSPDAYPVVGVLANLRDMKGHQYIIQALPSILEKWPDTTFLFAGRDDSNGAIEQQARDAGVHHAIRFLGFVPDPTPLFAAMDMLLLPSDWEGFPVSILETMQAGVPVIASNVGGIPEMIEHGVNGILISPRSPGEISSAVQLLSKDFALRASLVKSADARYQAEFTLDRMTLKLTKLYAQLVKNAC